MLALTRLRHKLSSTVLKLQPIAKRTNETITFIHRGSNRRDWEENEFYMQKLQKEQYI